jgi:NAD(P)-dependent dehydrogenase (short-subunit alcohol dehydrogenase family)
VGRSPLPSPESPETSALDAAALRKWLIDKARTGGARVMPAEIERDLHGRLRNREILATIAAIRSAGAEVEYHSVDVRDAAAVGRLLDDIYARLGRLDGVVHGAGVIEDKLIPDKSAESFERVMSTKVHGALALAAGLRPGVLKFLVFFSSASARFGNVGQADYAAANEVLNKLATSLARTWPGRVVSIGWGPWDAGMISPELRERYTSHGIQPLPVAAGVAAFHAELAQAGPAETVIGTWSLEAAVAGGMIKA